MCFLVLQGPLGGWFGPLGDLQARRGRRGVTDRLIVELQEPPAGVPHGNIHCHFETMDRPPVQDCVSPWGTVPSPGARRI